MFISVEQSFSLLVFDRWRAMFVEECLFPFLKLGILALCILNDVGGLLGFTLLTLALQALSIPNYLAGLLDFTLTFQGRLLETYL